MSRNNTLIFTATLNEKDNIDLLSRKILSLSDGYDMLVVDDNSADGTGQLLDRLSEEIPRLYVIHRPRKLGLGTAHKLAILYAIKNGYKTLVTMDADLSHNPDDIPRLLEELENNDFVTGSRYMPGGSCEYVGSRKIISKIANFLVRFLLGIKLHECTTSFRAFSVKMLSDVASNKIHSEGYSFFFESLFMYHRLGYKCSEIPIHFKDRATGKSKISKTEVIKSIYNLLFLFISRILGKSIYVAPHIESLILCYNCKSPYLLERFAEKTAKVINEDTYKCTSMNHKSNPQVYSCLECGLHFASNITKNLTEYYSGVIDLEYLKHKPARVKTFNENFNKIAPYISKGGKLLEIGAYCGFFLEIAREHNFSVTGVEPSIWASQYAKDTLNLDVKVGTLDENMHNLDKDYDVVVLWDVLEHLNDPVACLSQIQNVLKPGGVLCFSTFDVDNWFPKIMGSHWPWLMDMHLFYYTRAIMVQLLKQSNYEMIEVTDCCHYISVSYLIDKIQALMPFSNDYINDNIFLKVTGLLKSVAPKNILIPFSFGDIKIYICRYNGS
jgi:dolichol-phosphate mannosyltransferase